MTTVELTRAKDAPAVPDTMTGPSVGSLVQLAIEKGVDVTLLERLVALKERVEERDARKAYFDALARFQKECPPIPHDKTAKVVSKRSGARFQYTYASLPQITKTIAPHMESCGLSYTWDTEYDGKVFTVICTVRHLDGHSERASFPVPIDGGERMSAAQANGAALTYGRRQTLIAVLGLTTADTDVDGADGDEEGDQTITQDQVATLSDLIDAVGADKARFLRFMKVESLAEIPASRFKEAVTALEDKRRAGV